MAVPLLSEEDVMSRWTISGFFGLALALAAVLAAAPVGAQGRDSRCRDYSRDAVDQARENDRRNCGYSGPRWSGDATGHFAWCMLFPRQAEDENRARAEDLRRCSSGGGRRGDDDRGGDRGNREGKRANCDTYSRIAEVQAEANDKFKCGNRGGEWSTSKRSHFEWCMTNKREFALDEQRFRAQELQKCFNNLGDYDDERYDRNYRRRF
jgi:hypothetical protein